MKITIKTGKEGTTNHYTLWAVNEAGEVVFNEEICFAAILRYRSHAVLVKMQNILCERWAEVPGVTQVVSDPVVMP